jgi:hypothetical protein
MAYKNMKFAYLFVALAMCGCSFASDALFPSLSEGSSQEVGVERVSVTPSDVAEDENEEVTPPPEMGTTNFKPLTVTPGTATGTFVGQKVITFRKELDQLQKTILRRNAQLQSIRDKSAEDARRYHETVAFINARLQVGTTPGNPKMQAKWQKAQKRLEMMSGDVTAMNQLATQVAMDSAMTSYLLDSVRAAYNLSGAVDEDHHQLRVLEDETNQTAVLIERLLTELNEDIKRQQQYVAGEKRNLDTLALAIKDGQLYGASLASQQNFSRDEGSVVAQSANSLPVAETSGRRALVVIRFDRPNVPYEQALYRAVKTALERQPDAMFDLVAVTPVGLKHTRTHNARRYAEAVLRSLSSMGLPASRVKLSAMNSSQALSSEVHLYVR